MKNPPKTAEEALALLDSPVPEMPLEFPSALADMREKLVKDEGMPLNISNSTDEEENNFNISKFIESDQTSVNLEEFQNQSEGKPDFPRSYKLNFKINSLKIIIDLKK